MSSIFTAPGTNARDAQEQEQHSAAGVSSNTLNQYAPYVGNQIDYMKGQQPQAQNAVNQLGQFTTQGGRNNLVASFGANARGNAQTAGAQMPGEFAGNPALSQAHQLGAYNDANQATNQYAQRINSPEGEASAYGTYLQGLQSQSPDFQGISSLTGNVYGQPPVQVGQGLFGYLGNIAGSAAQAYAGKK